MINPHQFHPAELPSDLFSPHTSSQKKSALLQFVLRVLIIGFVSIQYQVVIGQPQQVNKSVESNRMVEIPFTSTEKYKDPFNEVILDVVFTTPDARELKVPPFSDAAHS